MLTQRPDDASRFTRRDAGRLALVAVVLVAILTAILAMDIIPTRADVEIGSLATRDIVAPRALTDRAVSSRFAIARTSGRSPRSSPSA